MKIINAKFNSYCAETGCKIRKGERMVYDPIAKKCYAIGSSKATAVINNREEDIEASNTIGMVQANEEAFFDNFCHNNGI